MNFVRPNAASINVFYIIINNIYIKKDIINNDEGFIKWYSFINDKLYDVRNSKLTREGATSYFINYSLSREGIDTSKL